MQHLYVIELACSVGTGKTLDEFFFFCCCLFFFACSVMDRAESKIFPVRTKQASSITVLLLWLDFEFPDSIRPCYTRQFFLQLFVARQVARNISRVTPQFCNLQRQQNVALRVARKVEISCAWHVHRNLQGNFVKIRQSEPVFCSQKISSWRRKSCKQFPPGALQVAKKILRTWDTPSATCNVFQSSSLRDKLQEKLPRVTWPIGRLYRRNARATKTKQEYIISWTKTLLLTMPVSKTFCHILGQTTTKMFLLHAKKVPVEHLFKHTINETSL